MNTIALSSPDTDGNGWDLVVDANGNLAVNAGGVAIAQDVASAVRTFLGECWYDSTLGIPYFQRILGYRPNLQFIKQQVIAAGSIVPGVASIAVFLTGPASNRQLGGQIQITTASGQTLVAETGNLLGIAPWWVSAISEEAAEAPTATILTGGGIPLSGGGMVLTQ